MPPETTLMPVSDSVSTPAVLRPLADLGSLINNYHDQAIGLANSSIEAALNCGHTLIEAKSQLPHGRWIPWLRGNCPRLGERQMQKYMRLANNWALIEARREVHPDAPISVEGVLSLIAEPVETTSNTNSNSYLPDGSAQRLPETRRPVVNEEAAIVATSATVVDAPSVLNATGRESPEVLAQVTRKVSELTEAEILHRRIGVMISRTNGSIRQLFLDADELFKTHDEPGCQFDAVIDLAQQLNELLLDLQRRVSRKAEEYRLSVARENDDGSGSEPLTNF